MYNFQCSNCFKPIPSISQQILDLDRHLIIVSEMLWRERLADNFRMQQTQASKNINENQMVTTYNYNYNQPSQNIPTRNIPPENDFQKHKKLKTIQQNPNKSSIQNQFETISVTSSRPSLGGTREIQKQTVPSNPATQQYSIVNPYISLFFQDGNTNKPDIPPNNQVTASNLDTNQIHCPICQKLFASLSKKNRHIKKMHQILNHPGSQTVKNYSDYLNLNKDKNNDNLVKNCQINQSDLNSQDNKKNILNTQSYYRNYSNCFDQYLDNAQNNNKSNNLNNINNDNTNNERNNNHMNNKNNNDKNKNNRNINKSNSSNQNQKQSQQSIMKNTNNTANSESIQAQCPFCYKLFSHKSSKDKHLKKVHNVQNTSYISSTYKKRKDYLDTFSKERNNDNVTNSMKLIPNNSNIPIEIDKKQCPICLKIFTIASSKDRHLVEVHNISSNPHVSRRTKKSRAQQEIDKATNPTQIISNNEVSDFEIDFQEEDEKRNVDTQNNLENKVEINKYLNNQEYVMLENSLANNNLENSKANYLYNYLYDNNQENSQQNDQEHNHEEINNSVNVVENVVENNTLENNDQKIKNNSENNHSENNHLDDKIDNIVNLESISNNNENQQKALNVDIDDDDDGDSYPNQELVCQICHKEFKSNSAVMRHFLIMHEKSLQDEELICLDCDIRFDNDEMKQFHLKHVHGN